MAFAVSSLCFLIGNNIAVEPHNKNRVGVISNEPTVDAQRG